MSISKQDEALKLLNMADLINVSSTIVDNSLHNKCTLSVLLSWWSKGFVGNMVTLACMQF